MPLKEPYYGRTDVQPGSTELGNWQGSLRLCPESPSTFPSRYTHHPTYLPFSKISIHHSNAPNTVRRTTLRSIPSVRRSRRLRRSAHNQSVHPERPVSNTIHIQCLPRRPCSAPPGPSSTTPHAPPSGVSSPALLDVVFRAPPPAAKVPRPSSSRAGSSAWWIRPSASRRCTSGEYSSVRCTWRLGTRCNECISACFSCRSPLALWPPLTTNPPECRD